MRRRCTGMLLLWAALVLPATAIARATPYLPQVLEPWVAWVLEGKDHLQCPAFLPGSTAVSDHACAWPGPLGLTVDREGGLFEQDWQLATRGWIPLPGDRSHWPEQVAVGGVPAAVLEHDGAPAVHVEAGSHRVAGRFRWTRRPARLAVPAAVALIELRVDGQPLPFPEREGDSLWLGERPRESAVAEALEVKVFRRLEDGSPATLTTRVQLNVAGPARELSLGQALPRGLVPMSLGGSLPARIEADGNLRVQVRPGDWQLEYRARAEAPVESLDVTFEGERWPRREVWSYLPQPLLRSTRFEGDSPVDAAQAGVPPDWVDLAAYVLEPGAVVTLFERSRGRTEEQENRLQLSRDLWLDFDGTGFTARDELSGSLSRGWRLDMRAPFRLGYAAQLGETLLVTAGAEEGLSGVELRRADLALTTLSRYEDGGGEIPVSGWAESLDDVSTRLHLPPNHRLLAVRGADRVDGDWIGRWSLLDIFLVLLVAAVTTRLLGWVAGSLALATFVLVLQSATHLGWALLNVLLAVALVRVAPEGRLRRWGQRYRLVSFAIAVLLAVPFIAHETVLTLYPQLERPGAAAIVGRVPASAEPSRTEAAKTIELPVQELVAADAPRPPRAAAEVGALPARGGARQRELDGFAPGTLVQSGPPVPAWRWNSYQMSWGGPVTPAQTVELTVLPPALNVIWRVAGMLTLLALIAWLVIDAFGQVRGPRRAGGVAGALWLAALLGPTAADRAAAEIPDAKLLEELERRLLEPPACAPDCVSVSLAEVSAAVDRLRIDLTVEVGSEMAVPLPHGGRAWLPREIQLDGEGQRYVIRRGGTAYLRLPAGSHRLRLSGALAPIDTVELAFATVPRRVDVQAEGWDVTGVREGRLTGSTLRLTRFDGEATEALAPGQFPPFVQLRRQLDMGLEWHVEGRISRLAPPAGAIDLQVPLVPGETVLTPGLETRDGKLQAGLAAGQRELLWRSALSPVQKLRLAAPRDVPWTEVWRFRVGPQWRLRVQGVPPAALPTGDGWELEFYPWPGETLEIAIERPQAVPGPTFALDSARLNATLGRRSGSHLLQLAYRSTRAGEHGLTLPQAAILDAVSVDGQPRPLQLDAGRLTLPVEPGSHRLDIRFREERDLAAAWSMPPVDLGMPAGNLAMTVDVPGDRWVLWARGPVLGPAVLYWPEFVVFLAAAVVLGRIGGTPLRTLDWLLLGLGLSTVSWGLLALLAVWAHVFAWRGQGRPDWTPARFNLLQAGLAVFTIYAIGSLIEAIPRGLLGMPDMHVTGLGSSAHRLNWFQDGTDGAFPGAAVYSLPLWAYKGVILAWALWLSFALVRWLPWAWRCWTTDGHWDGRIRLIPRPANRPRSDEPDRG